MKAARGERKSGAKHEARHRCQRKQKGRYRSPEEGVAGPYRAHRMGGRATARRADAQSREASHTNEGAPYPGKPEGCPFELNSGPPGPSSRTSCAAEPTGRSGVQAAPSRAAASAGPPRAGSPAKLPAGHRRGDRRQGYLDTQRAPGGAAPHARRAAQYTRQGEERQHGCPSGQPLLHNGGAAHHVNSSAQYYE